jgi:hypothetical protein
MDMAGYSKGCLDFRYSEKRDVVYRKLNFMGYSGYRVGTDGSVWSRWASHGPGSYVGRKWGKMSGSVNNEGYLRVAIRHAAGDSRSSFVHRLVCAAFNGTCPYGMECRHLNGAKEDNRLENLAWGSHQQNIADKTLHGTVAKGESHSQAKLTASDVVAMRLLAAEGMSAMALGRRFSVSGSAAWLAITGKKWKSVATPPVLPRRKKVA